MSDSLQEEVQNSFQAYTSLWQSRADLLSSVSRLLSQHDGSAAGVQHRRPGHHRGYRRRTVVQGLRCESDFPGDRSQRQSDRVAGRQVTTIPLDRNLHVVPEAAKKFPQQSTGFFLQNGELYQISVTPVYVDSTHGRALLNVLVAGYRVDARWRNG